MSLSPVFALYRSLAALLARFQRHAFTRRGDFCDSKKHLAATHGQRRRSTHKPEEAPSLHGTLTVQIPAQCPAASYGSSSFGPRPSDYTVTPPSSLIIPSPISTNKPRKRSDIQQRRRRSQLGSVAASSSSFSSSPSSGSSAGSCPTPFECCGAFYDLTIQQLRTDSAAEAPTSPKKPHFARYGNGQVLRPPRRYSCSSPGEKAKHCGRQQCIVAYGERDRERGGGEMQKRRLSLMDPTMAHAIREGYHARISRGHGRCRETRIRTGKFACANEVVFKLR